MKNLLVGLFLGFLIASVLNNHVSAAQAQRLPARIWVGADLQLGMPKEAVITKVAEAGYEITRQTAVGGDFWTVMKKNQNNEHDFIGNIIFVGGKLESAEHSLYASTDQPVAKFARSFYFAVRDLEADHNSVCTLESKNEEQAVFESKSGMLHCRNRTISVTASKLQDQDEEVELTESVK
jgi:hypothetical protein